MRLILLSDDDQIINEFLWTKSEAPKVVQYQGEYWALSHPMVALKEDAPKLSQRVVIGYFFKPVAVAYLMSYEQKRASGRGFV